MRIIYCITLTVLAFQLANGQDEISKNRDIFFQKMLARRREEHLILQKNLLSFKYEQQYKLLDIAIKKLFELTDENKNRLETDDFKANPAEKQISESIILENICLLSDFLLNFNKMTYDVLGKIKFNYIEKLKWSLEFTKDYSQYFDAITDKELKFISENLQNIVKRKPLENPFENNLQRLFQQSSSESTQTNPKPKKKKKSLKKGPQLTSYGEL